MRMASSDASRRHTGVPGQSDSTLYLVQAENRRLRERVHTLEDALGVALHRIELLQGFAWSLQRGERPSWWERKAAALGNMPALPAEIQAVTQMRFQERLNAVQEYIVEVKRTAELTADRIAEQNRRMQWEQYPTAGLIEPPAEEEV